MQKHSIRMRKKFLRLRIPIWMRLRRVLFRNIGKDFEGNTDFLRFF